MAWKLPQALKRASGGSAAGFGLLGFLPSFLMAVRYSQNRCFSPKHRHSPKAVETTFQGDNKPERLGKEMFDGHGAIMAGKLQSIARERPSGTRSEKLPTRTHRSDELLCGPFSRRNLVDNFSLDGWATSLYLLPLIARNHVMIPDSP
jgi:hypothetical protein